LKEYLTPSAFHRLHNALLVIVIAVLSSSGVNAGQNPSFEVTLTHLLFWLSFNFGVRIIGLG
jgi:hypothetical protein